MTVQIDVNGHRVPFTLNWDAHQWQSAKRLQEGEFPLVTVVDARRYELYSDGTFAEVEL
jgi:hypothetical protein